jgi:FkbM family methyltransferase
MQQMVIYLRCSLAQFYNKSRGYSRHSRLTAGHVIWAYRLFLDRDPENAEVVLEKLRAWGATDILRADFLYSNEFSVRNPDLAYTSEEALVIVPLEDDVYLWVDLSDRIVGLPIARRTYEQSEMSFVREHVHSGQNVLDIGGHIGLFTMIMASLVGEQGKVYTFEPGDKSARLLQRSIQQNAFEERVTFFQNAVGHQTGMVNMITPENDISHAGLRLFNQQASLMQGASVQPIHMVMLDNLSLRRPIHFIKVDAEGAEPFIFQGAQNLLRQDRPVILSEIHTHELNRVTQHTPRQLIAYMASLGYTCHILEHGQLREEIVDTTDHICSVVFLPKGDITHFW